MKILSNKRYKKLMLRGDMVTNELSERCNYLENENSRLESIYNYVISEVEDILKDKNIKKEKIVMRLYLMRDKYKRK